MQSGKLAADAKGISESVKTDFESESRIDESDRVMLRYALKLTKSPQAMVAGDVDGLREAGFDDLAIHDICAVTAYFAFVNRIADGLGVELESRAADD